MKGYSLLPVILVCVSMTCLFACKKDDVTPPTTSVVEKKGLIVSGDQEVPVKTTPASGTLDVSYNKDTHLFTFTVKYTNLTGVPTGSHIHGIAARGTNAGIKYDFFDMFPQAVSGTFTNTLTVDSTTAIKQDSLLLGFYYLNIHTAANPGGEIRGQIEF
jgi:hypothetical protein